MARAIDGAGRSWYRPCEQDESLWAAGRGLDTRDANTTLGFEDDERDYGVAALAVRRWDHVYANRRLMPSMLRISLAARLRALPHPLVVKIGG
jgi:hypothetical protein